MAVFVTLVIIIYSNTPRPLYTFPTLEQLLLQQ